MTRLPGGRLSASSCPDPGAVRSGASHRSSAKQPGCSRPSIRTCALSCLLSGHVGREIRDEILGWDILCEVVTGDEAKWQAFGVADVAIAASGTVLLELALAGVPHISCYKLDPVSRLLSRLITAWTAALPNMIADRVVVSEYYDGQVRSERVARQAAQLAGNTLHRAAMLSDFDLIRSRMEVGVPASKKAAATLLSVLDAD